MVGTPAKPSGAIAVVPLKAFDTRGAVVKDTVNAVAVVADNTWKARKLAKGLRVTWSLPSSTSSVDSTSLAALAQNLMNTGVPVIAEPTNPTPTVAAIEGQIATAQATASKTVTAQYTLPYAAHATMEVLNCSVKFTFDALGAPIACEAWAPNQAALSVVNTIKAHTTLQSSQIIVHTTFLGGGLGRKIEQDYISQAVQVALAVKKPVKLTWFREEDFGHDQYRPTALVKVKAGLDSAHNIQSWLYRTVTPSILGQRRPLAAGTADSQAVEGAIHLPYELGVHACEWIDLPAGIPVGFWRSVGSSINAFVVECFVDELAQLAGKDPFEYRYQIISDPRARAALAEADTRSSWRHSLPSTHTWGLAMAQSFGTWVCEVAEVSEPALGSLKVHRVTCVVDCGTVINPGSVEAQMQGGIVHGLNAALWGQTTFLNGVANQTNFNKSRVIRLNEMPVIDVTVMTTAYPPSGIGEPGVPPIAPAIANAYSRLKGSRVYSLPLFPNATMGGL